jgi:hypothetical protein
MEYVCIRINVVSTEKRWMRIIGTFPPLNQASLRSV